MELTFSLLLTILLELPIIAFFFRKQKRKYALTIGFFTNIITWSLANIIRFNFQDWNQDYVMIGVVILEGFAYWLFLGRNIKKAVLITIVANAVSYTALKFVHFGPDILQKNTDLIR